MIDGLNSSRCKSRTAFVGDILLDLLDFPLCCFFSVKMICSSKHKQIVTYDPYLCTTSRLLILQMQDGFPIQGAFLTAHSSYCSAATVGYVLETHADLRKGDPGRPSVH